MSAPIYPPGTTISGRYVLRQKLGSDGSVYRAYDRHLDKEVAIKLLHPEAGAPHTWDEAQRLEALRSRFVIDVINADVIAESDIRFIVTPVVEGGDLEALAAGTGLGVAQAVHLTQQIATGVDRIHAAGMVHRDIKPANALLVGDGVVVSDLQFCEIVAASGRAGRNGSWCTLAPETAVDSGYTSTQTDVYSLGATAFYLLTGEYPVDHRLPRQEQKTLIQSGKLRDIRKLAPHVPQGVAAAVHKALSHDPERRFSSGEKFANALVHAVRHKRDWKRVVHDGHLHCLEGDAIRSKAAVKICAVKAGGKVAIQSRYRDTDRRVPGFPDEFVTSTALPNRIRQLVRQME